MSDLKPLILIILDGFGIGSGGPEDAVSAAKKPNLDELFRSNPTYKIAASGLDVGLPDGQMGNSEVGHMNLGAGRVVYQELTRITKSIEDGSFFDNPVLNDVATYVAKNDATLHLCGLLSDGGVHSHIDHLYAILETAKLRGVKKVRVHAWTDGRDVNPKSAIKYIKACEKRLSQIGLGTIETVTGRYYSMDRDSRWERTEAAYQAMANAVGREYESAVSAVEKSYEEGITDEFIQPFVAKGYGGISDSDAVICFNFRPDRARQITRRFVDKNLDYAVKKRAFPQTYVCFTRYDESIPDVKVAFEPQIITDTFGKSISDNGLRQLRIAETEKYAHVTFFFNGGIEKPYPGEDRILVPSPKVKTYDLKPEMSACEITDITIDKIKKGLYDVIVLNYANCDMVGHTGNLGATVKAVETVDECVGRVVAEAKKAGWQVVITADHGNAEKLLSSDGTPFTAHTTNLVPLCIVSDKTTRLKAKKLADVAPILLDLLDPPQAPNRRPG